MPWAVAIVAIVLAFDWVAGKLSAMDQQSKTLTVVCAVVVVVALVMRTIVNGGKNADPTPAASKPAQPLGSGSEAEPPPARPGRFKLADGLARTVLLTYDDTSGERTERLVRVQQAFARGAGQPITHLRGYCHLRRGVRTFRTDRIKSAADPETGEIIANLDAYILPPKSGLRG